MAELDKVIAWLADTELFYRDHGDLHNSEMACNALELLKKQKGSWDYGTQCSVCKGTIIPPKDRSVHINFCPWCGADMRDNYK